MSPPGPFHQTTQMVSIKLCPPKPVYSVSLYFHFSCICICIRICIRVTLPLFLLASPTTRLKCRVQIIQFYQCPPQLLYYCILYSLCLYLYFLLSLLWHNSKVSFQALAVPSISWSFSSSSNIKIKSVYMMWYPNTNCKIGKMSYLVANCLW